MNLYKEKIMLNIWKLQFCLLCGNICWTNIPEITDNERVHSIKSLKWGMFEVWKSFDQI